jgi:hypothetical protein
MAPVAPLVPRTSHAVARIDPVAAAWGGLVASIGLLAGAGRDWPARLAAAALSFALGGFLAGVRAAARRPGHAGGAWIVAYVIHAAFIAVARAVDAMGGPDAPALVAGGGSAWAGAAAWALVWALIGGVLANAWLRPAGRGPVL